MSAKRVPDLKALEPLPRRPLVDKMCARCPFRPDGSGYAADHPDFPTIKASVELTGQFFCHETVVLDERTTMDATGDMPEPPFQAHFRQCQGAWNHYMVGWRKRASKAMAAHRRDLFPGKKETP